MLLGENWCWSLFGPKGLAGPHKQIFYGCLSPITQALPFGTILVNEMCMCNHNVLNYVLRQRKKQKKLSAKKKKEERKDDGEL